MLFFLFLMGGTGGQGQLKTLKSLVKRLRAGYLFLLRAQKLQTIFISIWKLFSTWKCLQWGVTKLKNAGGLYKEMA